MARYRGPKTKISRKFGEPLFGEDRTLEKKNYPPGQHGNTKDLLKIGVYRSINIHPTAIDKEFFHTYILKIDKNSINLDYKNNEVDDLKFISIEEMESLIKEENNKIFIGKNRKYYSDVLKSIKSYNYQ